jgi:hypothetical protein
MQTSRSSGGGYLGQSIHSDGKTIPRNEVWRVRSNEKMAFFGTGGGEGFWTRHASTLQKYKLTSHKKEHNRACGPDDIVKHVSFSPSVCTEEKVGKIDKYYVPHRKQNMTEEGFVARRTTEPKMTNSETHFFFVSLVYIQTHTFLIVLIAIVSVPSRR